MVRRLDAVLFAVAAAVLAGLCGCQHAPARTIPDPLPEVLDWALPERTPRALLGAVLAENDSGALEDLAFDAGLVVVRVSSASPAARAGLRAGDVALTANGVELFAPQDVDALLASAVEGDVLTLEVQRGDTVFEVPVVLVGAGEHSGGGSASVRASFHLDPARSQAAWGDGERDGRSGAVLVSRRNESPVGRLPIGTLVFEVDGREVLSGRGLVRNLTQREPGDVVVLRGHTVAGETRDFEVELLDEGRVTTRASVPVLFTYDADLEADRRRFVLIDLWIISLLRYERDGAERRWRLLRFFEWSSGVGELGS